MYLFGASIDGKIHHFAIVMTGSYTKLYMDGSLLVTGNAGTVAMRTLEGFIVG